MSDDDKHQDKPDAKPLDEFFDELVDRARAGDVEALTTISRFLEAGREIGGFPVKSVARLFDSAVNALDERGNVVVMDRKTWKHHEKIFEGRPTDPLPYPPRGIDVGAYQYHPAVDSIRYETRGGEVSFPLVDELLEKYERGDLKAPDLGGMMLALYLCTLRGARDLPTTNALVGYWSYQKIFDVLGMSGQAYDYQRVDVAWAFLSHMRVSFRGERVTHTFPLFVNRWDVKGAERGASAPQLHFFELHPDAVGQTTLHWLERKLTTDEGGYFQIPLRETLALDLPPIVRHFRLWLAARPAGRPVLCNGRQFCRDVLKLSPRELARPLVCGKRIRDLLKQEIEAGKILPTSNYALPKGPEYTAAHKGRGRVLPALKTWTVTIYRPREERKKSGSPDAGELRQFDEILEWLNRPSHYQSDRRGVPGKNPVWLEARVRGLGMSWVWSAYKVVAFGGSPHPDRFWKLLEQKAGESE